MKRNNKLMKASGVLLVLTLITSCFVGGTLAKYVSENDGKDSARVAKWGVTVEVTGDEAFAETYGKDDVNSKLDGNSVASAGSESVTFTWNSSTGSKNERVNISDVIAPGTKGTFGGIKVTGTPEVAVKIETNAEVDFTGWDVNDGEFYCPLVFEIDGKTINGLDYSSGTAGGASSFENAIKTAIENAASREVSAGTNLRENLGEVTYSWEWPFENATGTELNQSDELDTLLGKNALGEDDTEIPAVYIKVTTTVTQID